MTRQHSRCVTCRRRFQQALWCEAMNQCNACIFGGQEHRGIWTELAREAVQDRRDINDMKHRALKATEGER